MQKLVEPHYDSLWCNDFDSLCHNNPPDSKRLLHLVSEICALYDREGVSPTDTLVTKVLLGTVCCTPAYDSFFVTGVDYWNKSLSKNGLKFPARFCEESYLGLWSFCREYEDELRAAQAVMADSGASYPPMKLVDMYFWGLGWLASQG